MYLCGIPAVRITGTEEDWKRLADCWRDCMSALDTHGDYYNRVMDILDDILRFWDSEDTKAKAFWKNLFTMERCGSGSQVEVRGWITELFLNSGPQPGYTSNYSSHISVVEYFQIDTEKDYMMKDGLLYSFRTDKCLVPMFSSLVMEKLESPVSNPEDTLQVDAEPVTYG